MEQLATVLHRDETRIAPENEGILDSVDGSRNFCGTIMEVMSRSCKASGAPAVGDLVGFLVARDGVGRLRLFGELDAAVVPQVRACLVGVDGDIEIDCSGLSFMDAAGLGLFVELHAECRARSAQLAITNPSRCVVRLLELGGLDSVLTGTPATPAR
jgi:anti-anti-sigma factor